MRDPVYHGLTVPGSILLAGEYAVLTEGGLGLALAAEPRVSATWEKSDCFKVTSHFADKTVQWTAQDQHAPALLECVWHQVSKALGQELTDLRYHVTLDSTALSQVNGRKSGLGSSAATAVSSTAALCYLVTRTRPAPDRVFQAALAAHREFQGGLGSGYDVACSTYGGVGLFSGGQHPGWASLDSCHVPPLKLIAAPRSVSTSQAIIQWQTWKRQYPERWKNCFDKSQAVVRTLTQALDHNSFHRALKHAAELGQELGRAMGVWDAENHAFMEQQAPCKTLGAGNELLARICDESDPNRMELKVKGILWS
jgi:phosphomevalonate kinase